MQAKSTVIRTGTLPKTGEAYDLVLVGSDHLDEAVALHDSAYQKLAAQDLLYLWKKNREDFVRHVDKGNVVVGALVNGHVAGMSMMTYPNRPSEAPEVLAQVAARHAATETAILKGTVVHEDFRGNNLQSAMAEARLKLALESGRPHAYSAITAGNVHSFNSLMRRGFKIVSLGTDPEDGTQTYGLHGHVPHLLRRRAQPEFNRVSAVMVKSAALAEQRELLAVGYRGVEYDFATDQIAFTLPRACPAAQRQQQAQKLRRAAG